MANELSERVRGYLAARSERERKVLLGGAVLLAALLGYGMVYEPLARAREKLAGALPMQRAELRLMRVQVAEIERLRGSAGAGSGTLEQRIKASAASFGLVGNFTRFTAASSDQVLLATQAMSATTWSDWLGDLERHGITVQRCRISGSGQPGQASLELTLTGGPR